MDPVPLLDLQAQFASLRDEIYRAMEEIVDSQQFVLGSPVERLEAEVARYVGAPHAVGCASGTDALILSLAALDLLRVHGGEQMYHHRYVGWNSRLDALQAAVLRVKLPRLDDWSSRRAANAERYDRWFNEAGLVASGSVTTPPRAAHSNHIFNQYTLRVVDRDRLREHLRERGIGHSVYYPVPLHLQECFRDLGYAEGDFPHAERACREVVSLPVYPELAREQQERVVEAIAEFYR